MIDRVRDRDTFERLRREGVRVRVDPLWCSFVDDQAVQPPKVAFALSRALGSAVTRNRLRRRLRAILRSTDLPHGLVLIGAKPAACELTFAELRLVVNTLIDALIDPRVDRRVDPRIDRRVERVSLERTVT